MNGADPGVLLDYAHYALPAGAAMPGNHFEGRLALTGEAGGGGFTEHVDSFRYTGSQDSPLKHLPEFDFELVQTGSHIVRSEEHTSELQSLMRISYAFFCLKKKK